ncbi:MAG TPA: hypothetical protein VGC02_03605 [Methanobacterium sp.]
MDRNVAILIGAVIVLVAVIGLYEVYPIYTTQQFNEHFKKADTLLVEAQNQLNQTSITTKSSTTNIELCKNASNLTDQAIDELNICKQYTTDNITKEYLDLRIQQCQERKNLTEILTAIYEQLGANGIFAVVGLFNEKKTL